MFTYTEDSSTKLHFPHQWASNLEVTDKAFANKATTKLLCLGIANTSSSFRSLYATFSEMQTKYMENKYTMQVMNPKSQEELLV